MIRALCFDFDGTLAHFTGDFEKLLNRGYAELGLDPQLRNAVLTEYAQQLRKDGAITSLGAMKVTLKQLNLRSEADLEAINAEFIRAYREQMELLPGAKEVLKFCSSHPCALITNGPEDMQRAALEEVGITPYFQTILISGTQEVAVRKPDARIFELACERMGVQPEEVLMIGDNLGADIRGALGVGMEAVYVGSCEEEVQQVANLFELRDLLEDYLQ